MVAVLAKRPARILHAGGVKENAHALDMSARHSLMWLLQRSDAKERIFLYSRFCFRMNMACAQASVSFRDSGSWKRLTEGLGHQFFVCTSEAGFFESHQGCDAC
jgi:hypothetical protein